MSERTEITVITPPVAESDIDRDLVNLTRYIWDTHHAGEPYFYGLGGQYGYGTDFENDVFEMRPFWWGECDCGRDEREAEADFTHTAECFGTRYHAEDERVRDLMSWDERSDHMTAWAKANGYARAPFGMAVHCDCGTHERWLAWADANPHAPTCSPFLPNFRHKASGIETRWYKWIGRDMEWNREPDPDEWRRIFQECVASVGGAP